MRAKKKKKKEWNELEIEWEWVTVESSIVHAVAAQDFDTGINAHLSFSLFGPNANKFVIDQLTGAIFAAEPLIGHTDVNVRVKVVDQGNDPRSDSTTVTVRFQPQDNFPQIHLVNISECIPENQALNTVVGRVAAITKRQGSVLPISYYLAAGNSGDTFQMSQTSGEITLRKHLDFEDIIQYKLWVEARDSGLPPFSSYVKIDINISDENDNIPQFTKSIFRCEIFENSAPGIVCKVSATDEDSGQNGILQYSFKDINSVFMINATTGIIRTTLVLDREHTALYILTVQAKDQGIIPQTGSATVIINILDQNDNAPRFLQIFLTNIPENVPIGFSVLQIKTSDEDIGINSVSTYTIADENSHLPFAIEKYTGYLKVVMPLDRETTDRYVLKVNANDSAWSVNTDVTICITDVNDNAPLFTHSSYTITIPEVVTQETFVVKVFASDADCGLNGQIFFYMKSSNEFFRVNATTGEIFTKKIIPFQNPYNDTFFNNYNFTVMVSDAGEKAMVNECKVIINIVPRNIQPPKFLPVWPIVSIPKHTKKGTKVIKLTAVDNSSHPNDVITYSITGGNGSSIIGIEKNTGWVFLNVLPSSVAELYSIVFIAEDNGIPSLSDDIAINFVITEDNRFTPHFSEMKIHISVSEDCVEGSVIGRVSAIDADESLNGLLVYAVVTGNDDNNFAIENTTGMIMLCKSLDFETKSAYILHITATDKGWLSKSSSVIVTIHVLDVDDNLPVFSRDEYFIYLAEDSPIGTAVLQLSAYDADLGENAEINYAIENDEKDTFAVDLKTGLLYTCGYLDFELCQIFELQIKAYNPSNSEHFSIAKVYVNVLSVNEYFPKFIKSQYNFMIPEVASIGTSVGRVFAIDYDYGLHGVVYYMFIGQSKWKGFSISRLTGELFVSGNIRKHSERQVTLKVVAKNSGNIHANAIDKALITITFHDVNDPPFFSCAVYQTHVREDMPVGSSVITLYAYDVDLVSEWNTFSFRIQQGNHYNNFYINPFSGVVYITSPLDRESTPSHSLTVIAIDKAPVPSTGSTQLEIIVDDINDNSPILITTEVHIMENQAPGTFILQFNATDYDLPPNQGPFLYQVMVNSNYLTLSPDGGLTTNSLIDREEVDNIYLPITIKDSGVPSMITTATVHVIVLDQNDNPSQPRNIYIQINSYGDSFPGGFIGNIKPKDPDISDVFNCRILSGPSHIFNIPANSCDLFSSVVLNDNALFNLIVEANDSVHNNVVSSIHIRYTTFNNATIDSSIQLYLSAPSFETFLSNNFIMFVETINNLLSEKYAKAHVFGMMSLDDEALLFVSFKQSNGLYLQSNSVADFFNEKRNLLEIMTDVKITSATDNICSEHLCQNGGSCQKTFGMSPVITVFDSLSVIFVTHRFTFPFLCECSTGYTGPHCEVNINECQSSPCLNNRICVNDLGGYFCSSSEGFSGQMCATDTNQCEKNICQNEGPCLTSVGSFHCHCAAGYTGNQSV
ncbi:protocadherin Fat 4-like [Protopterus annectens]|uniref:protocadherin Fat 4-like n=1 Tax=Protopterus annectens TaxID=7888 RepID=UPI001CF9C1E3|nr:protocadherin Fat 4-like [Protopterus annectens]